MGWFKTKVDPTEVANLRAELTDVRAQLDSVQRLRAQLDDLARQRDEADSRATQLANRLREGMAGMKMLDQRIDALDTRLTSVSKELSNQLGELSHDIEAASASAAAAAEGDPAARDHATAAVEALRTGQVKLANEQARFEIAFRDDLATLAEQIRRQR